MPSLSGLEKFGRSLEGVASRFIEDVNPIRVFKMQQARKLAFETQGIRATSAHVPSARTASIGARKVIRRNEAKTRPGIGFGDRLKAYFNGYNMDDIAGLPGSSEDFASTARSRISRMDRAQEKGHSLYAKVAQKRAMTRRITAGVVGAGTIGTMMLGRDNMVSEGGISGMTAGATGLAAAGIAGIGRRMGSPNMGAMGAAALIGYSAINMYRDGDQWGPF